LVLKHKEIDIEIYFVEIRAKKFLRDNEKIRRSQEALHPFTASPNAVFSNLCSPKHIDSKTDQRPPGNSLCGRNPPSYSPTPEYTYSINYFKLIIPKIVFK
jgi:hypothetical protein